MKKVKPFDTIEEPEEVVIFDEVDELEALEDVDSPSSEENLVDQKIYLIFLSGNNTYAVEAQSVKEILHRTEVFPLPFLPAFVSGLINYNGSPYTAIDLEELLNNKSQISDIFLILNTDNNSCLKVDDVFQFERGIVREINSDSPLAKNEYLKAVVQTKQRTAFLLDVSRIEESVKNRLKGF